MKQIVNGRQMKELDYDTIHSYGVESLVLMERAALAVTEELKKNFDTGKILVICGSGNNGADGMAAARILHLEGYRVDMYLAGKMESFTPEAKIQWKIAGNYGISVVNNFRPDEYTSIVDAVFGVGLSREVTGKYRELFELVNRSRIPVLAADIPSGICSATGKVMGTAIRAAKTVTFAYAKAGLYLYPGAFYSGEVIVRDIGIYGQKPGALYALDENEIDWIPPRRSDGNKGTFGKVLIVAGSKNMSGAAYFSAKAAMLTGAGMVRIFTEESNRVILQQLFPEAMLTTYGQGDSQDEIIRQLSGAADWADVAVVGPGIGTSEEALWILEELIKEDTEKPLLIDADGLNLLAGHLTLLAKCGRPYILTPHMGEMSRLSEFPMQKLKEQMRECLEEFWGRLKKLSRSGPVIVLKDARTMTITDDQTCYLNLTGNSGMATAGSGDVLSGIIAGLLAQGTEVKKAAPLGVWLHGKAGDLARDRMGERSMAASDILEAIPGVMRTAE